MRHFLAVLLLMGVIEGGYCGEASTPEPSDMGTTLSLKQAETLWQTHNREVRLARDAAAGAEADRIAAGARPNPQLTFSSASINKQNMRGQAWHDWQLDSILSINQLIERGGKRQLRQQSAAARAEAAQQDLSDTSRTSRLALYQAYYGLTLAQDQLRIARANAELSRSTLDTAETRLKAGDIAPSEVTRFRVDWLRAESDINQAETALADAQTTLAYLIGRERDATRLHVSDGWPEVTSADVSPLDVDQRPDVRAATARIKAAEATLELARALKTRDVAVGAGWEHDPAARYYSSPVDTLSLNVSLPLFINYQYEGEIRRAQADLQGARDDSEAVRANALSEISRARASLQTMAKRAQRYTGELLREAERAAKAAEFAYGHGAISVMDLLDTRRTLKSVQIDAAAAQAGYANALAAWRAATAIEEQTQ